MWRALTPTTSISIPNVRGIYSSIYYIICGAFLSVLNLFFNRGFDLPSYVDKAFTQLQTDIVLDTGISIGMAPVYIS